MKCHLHGVVKKLVAYCCRLQSIAFLDSRYFPKLALDLLSARPYSEIGLPLGAHIIHGGMKWGKSLAVNMVESARVISRSVSNRTMNQRSQNLADHWKKCPKSSTSSEVCKSTFRSARLSVLDNQWPTYLLLFSLHEWCASHVDVAVGI